MIKRGREKKFVEGFSIPGIPHGRERKKFMEGFVTSRFLLRYDELSWSSKELALIDKLLSSGEKAATESRKHKRSEQVGHECREFFLLALKIGCLSLEDIEFLLSRAIPVQKLYDYCVGPHQRMASYANSQEFNNLVAVQAHFLEMLLFICELQEPKREWLQQSRRRYEMAVFLHPHHVDLPDTPISEEQEIGSVWTKLVRNQKRFKTQSEHAIELVSNITEGKAVYWIFSLATGCHDRGFTCLAFDRNFVFRRDVSRSMDGKLRGMWTALFPAGRTSRSQMDPLTGLCRAHGLEIVGTPFVRPPLDKELHLASQRVSVLSHKGQVLVGIPRFYRRDMVISMIEKKHHDIAIAMESGYDKSNLEKRPRWLPSPPKKPKLNILDKCPLGLDECVAVAEVMKAILKKNPDFTLHKTYWYIEEAFSVWRAPTDKKSWLESSIGKPVKAFNLELKERTLLPSRAEIVRLVDEKVESANLSSHHRYAWYKFCRRAKGEMEKSL